MTDAPGGPGRDADSDATPDDDVPGAGRTVATLVWITGASAGLGAALVATQPYADAHVVDISRSGGTPGTEHLPADLADPAAWVAVEAHLAARIGAFAGERVVLVHAAGTLQPIGFAGEVDPQAYRRHLLLDAAGPAVGNAFLTAVHDSAFRGEVLLAMITSGAASSVYPGWSAYASGKAALDHWVRTVGAEQQVRGGATVLSVAPGVVATAMQDQIRRTPERDFPAVARFRQLYDDDALTPPSEAARRVWAALRGGIESGSVTDVRGG